MNNSMIRVIGIVFLVAGFFIDDIVGSFTVINEVEVVQLGLSQPSDEISSIVSGIDDIVKDKEDRLAIAIFNKVCADRIPTWPEFTQQEWNDIYVSAAKKFFGNSLRGKYADLDTFIVSLISDVTGDEIGNLSANDRKQIVDRLNGVSWYLIK